MRSCIARYSIKFLTLIFTVLVSGAWVNLHAQDVEQDARIEQISGSNVYINLGGENGINTGDTLFVYQKKELLGMMVVVSAASQSSSLSFADQPFSLTRGQTITVSFKKKTTTKQPEPREKEPVAETRTSILDRNNKTGERKAAVKIKPLIGGSVMFGENMNYSVTHDNKFVRQGVTRLYASPFSNINLHARKLPHQFDISMNMKWSYRYTDARRITPANVFRFYRLRVDKKMGSLPLYISAGRFYNRYEIFSGFWDGVMARVGSRRSGVGVISGFEPIRSNEGFTPDLPKYSFFAYHDYYSHDFNSSTEVAMSAIYPRNSWQDHLFLGAHQQIRFNRHRLTARVQVDQNPANQKWIVSQVLLRGYLAVTPKLTLHGVFNRRRPYRMWSGIDPISYLRTQYNGGFSYRTDNYFAGGDFTINNSEQIDISRSYSGYFRIHDTHFWDLGFNVNAFAWTSGSLRSIRVEPGFTRWFGKKQVQFSYQFYTSKYFSNANITHGISLQMNTPLWKSWYLNARAQSEYGSLLINNSLFFSVWKSF